MKRVVLLLPLLLAGCFPPDFKLIDQQTFERAPKPGATDIARAALPALPLAVIRFDQPDQDYTQALADAVDAATSRRPDVAFDVLTPVPTAAAPDVQARYTSQGAAVAQDVANALAADGVAPDHVHIGYRGDPGSPPREVRVYVR